MYGEAGLDVLRGVTFYPEYFSKPAGSAASSSSAQPAGKAQAATKDLISKGEADKARHLLQRPVSPRAGG